MAICCPVTLTGFCLEDGTPIGIVVSSGVQTGWINFETGITTPGPPPAGTGTCPVLTEISLDCATDSVSACVPYDYFEDSPHVSGDVGAFVLAVRNDSGLPLAADGDYVPFTTDAFGNLRVAASVAINYAYPEDSPHVSGDIGVFNLAVRNDAGTALAADGDYIPFTTDSTGALRVAASVTINSEYPEDSPHVSGDIGSFSLAVRNDAGTPLAADGDYIPFTTDATGALRVTGSAPTINFEYPEDSPHVSGDIGAFTLGVRNDAAATLTSANGDYSPFATDAAGRIGIADLGGSISIDDNGASITVDGTVTVLQGTSPWVVSGTVTADTTFDYAEDSPHVSGDIGAFVLAVRNDGAATLTSADGDYSPFAVDSAGRIGITTLGSSLTTGDNKTEDAPHSSGDTGSFVLAVRNDANVVLTSTDLDYSPIAVDSDGAVQISDGGNSITVDGTVTVLQGTSPWVVSGTVTADTNFDFAEDSIHVSGDIGAFVLAVRNDAGTPLAADGDYIPFTTDSTGALRVTGSAPTINFEYPEDSPHVSGDIGAFVLAVRNDTGTVLTSADGDYSAIAVNSSGRVFTFDISDRAEDSVHTSGDVGSFVLAVRNDAGTPLAADGDYIPFTTDSTGALRVTGGSSVTQFAEDSVHASGDLGMQTLAVRNDTPGTLTSADGDYASFQQDGAGGIRVAGTITHDTAIVTATHSPIITASRAQDNNTTITSVAAGDATFNLADLKGVGFVKEQRTQLLGIYFAGSGPHQLANAADAATGGRVWLVNTSSTIAVALKEILFTCISGTALVTLSFPRINVERMTFTGTPTGAQILPALRDSTDAANTGTLRTASTGMTITAGNLIKNFSPVTVLTAVGVSMPSEQQLEMQAHIDDRIVLRENEGIVVRQADGGTPADTRRFFLDFRWEEYTL